MGILSDIVAKANLNATEQGDNVLAGKISLSESLKPADSDVDELPIASVHIGALDASEDEDDSGLGCIQTMEVYVKCWVICEVEDVLELIIDANRAILGIQPASHITELILSSGFPKQINGIKIWYELTYRFKLKTKSE